ncbi:Phosphotransferase enzyme family protein [Micromonospora pattaloongensis]|uniref:Phosphotransferase enzyme family protein n=1 Tax=Micromonospora pattaloongensis TaxID=405436 RepID=A0A1H3RFW4_9ACTN|nr:aminoglycoside phosphotransferase family protein [Micromonospora pattaloongensis]SDZ24215.1 Phosphotransferase enzyme family protein [Micromonospora pattaloongensis]
MTDLDLLLALCQRLLDTDAVPAGWHSGHAGTRALRASTGTHGEVIVKAHRSPERHTQEVHAYRTRIPALEDRAPRLLAATDDPPAIVVTAVPGVPLAGRQLEPEAEQDAYRQAGQLLAALHAAGPARLEPDWIAWLVERAEYWIHRAEDRITASRRSEIRAHMQALRDLAPLPARPCHLDFMPRNMIYSDDGVVRLIDFEHSRYDLPARDLVRLATRIWPFRPDLRDSFLEGYGPLTAIDHEVIDHCAYFDALTKLCSSSSPEGRAAATVTVLDEPHTEPAGRLRPT